MSALIREKLRLAREYAANVRSRPVPCQCEQCRIAEMLPAVQRIVKN